MAIKSDQDDSRGIEKSGSYILPNDSPEHSRLDTQAQALYTLFGNRHSTAPINENASLIIDSGCGTGAVTRALAHHHPNAKVIGIDLSPVPSSMTDEAAPKNLEYIQGNVIELAGNHKKLQFNSADLVYSRLLIAGLKGNLWPTYVSHVASLVKPGGYLEMADLTGLAYTCTDPTQPIATKKLLDPQPEWLSIMLSESKNVGFDYECGSHLKTYMAETNVFEEIQVTDHPFPLGEGWLGKDYPPVSGFGDIDDQGKAMSFMFKMILDGTNALSELSTTTAGDVVDGTTAAVAAATKEGGGKQEPKYSEQRIQQLMHDCREAFNHSTEQFIIMTVAVGRKK